MGVALQTPQPPPAHKEGSMLKHTQRPMTNEEAARVNKRRSFFINRLFSSSPEVLPDDQLMMDVCDVSDVTCFIPDKFNEELPLFILNAENHLIIFYGQWLYDPNISLISSELFEKWDSCNLFFSNFSIQFSTHSGNVFKFKVNNNDLIKTTRINENLKFLRIRECQIIPGHKDTLIVDMRSSGLIE